MKSCIILCGGRSRRMGQDKGLMIFKSKHLIIHILETLELLVDEVILVTRDKNQLNNYKKKIDNYLLYQKGYKPQIKLITDLEMDQGPLMGLLTGLYQIKSNGALVLPCDSPFVSPSFINRIFKTSTTIKENKYLAIIPKWHDGRMEPLHAYYSKKCVPFIENSLKHGFNDVKSLFKIINVNYIDVEVLDPDRISFRNLNRPEDIPPEN